MLKVNLKKLKAYGDRLDDGVVQFSFTFPIHASPEAKEAAKIYLKKLGLEKISIATMEPMGHNFTYFVAYGSVKHTVDYTNIRVPKIETPMRDFSELKDYMSKNITEPIVVVGACTGADAHTVGIDAIMNMKGFAGDYGLERYPLFKAYNLRSQLTNEQLIEKAIELKADAILISQVVTQRDSHMKNLREFKKIIEKEKRLKKELVVIIGGPRIEHGMALKLGFDAGFGTGTKPSHVANFIVHEYMKRRHLNEKKPSIEIDKEPSFVSDHIAEEVKKETETTAEPEKKHHEHKKHFHRRGGRNRFYKKFKHRPK